MTDEIKPPLTIVILTFNEEINLPGALESVVAWADQVFVVDSFSTDKTLEIARKYEAQIFQNIWVDWATQRNWALDNLPIKNEWVLFLDADERVSPELAEEIRETLINVPNEICGFYVKRKFVFLGKWLRHGGLFPNFILRLVRKDKTRVKMIGAWEYFRVHGETLKMNNSVIHKDNKTLTHWINKHNQYADNEAKAIRENKKYIEIGSNGELERKQKVKLRGYIWNRLPLLQRSFFPFFTRYVIQRGFLDGIEGFIYYFLHDLWYPFLVDTKVLELKKRK